MLLGWLIIHVSHQQATSAAATCRTMTIMLCTDPIFLQLLEWIKQNDKRMHTIDLKNKSVQDHDVKILAEVLCHNTTVTHIDLSRNRIGDEGAIALASVLQCNQKLSKLQLGMNEIGPEGARHLANALANDQSRIKYLHLVGNAVGKEGAKAFAKALHTNTYLEKLGLEQNGIGDEGACAIGEALRLNNGLEKLELGGNDIGSDGASALAEGLRVNDRLGVLGLDGNNIQDAGAISIADALRSNTSLFWLCLGRNQIGERGAKSIADAIYDDRSPQHVLDQSNHHIEKIYGILDDTLRIRTRWNRGGVMEARRGKLARFLSDHPEYCPKLAELDIKCLPKLLHRVGRDCSTDAMFRHLCAMPDMFGECEVATSPRADAVVDRSKKYVCSRKWRRIGDHEKKKNDGNKINFDISLSAIAAKPKGSNSSKRFKKNKKLR